MISETAQNDPERSEPENVPQEIKAVRKQVSRDADEARRQGKLRRVIEIVDSAAALWGEENLFSNMLYEARLMKLEALFKLGEAAAAKAWCVELGRYYGPRHQLRIWDAQLAYHRHDLEGALQAVEDALLCLPVSESPEKRFFECCSLKAGSLVGLGRTGEARAFLRTVFHGEKVVGEKLLRPLRRTVDSPAALREFRDLLTSSFARKNSQSTQALLEYSVAARDLRNYPEAIKAITHRFVVGVRDVHKFGEARKGPAASWRTQASVTLLNLQADMASFGADFFLISGTLLGCVREGTILGHDKDIDVGVMTGIDVRKLSAHLAGTGRFVVLPEIHDRMLRLKHANGVMVDIFVHWESGGKLHHLGQKTGWWNTKFGLVKAPFLGGSFLIPDDAHRYLRENYGEWQQVNTNFDTFLDTPNVYIENSDELVWYYYKSLLEYYRLGKKTLYQRVWEALNKLRPPSPEAQMAFVASRQQFNAPPQPAGAGAKSKE